MIERFWRRRGGNRVAGWVVLAAVAVGGTVWVGGAVAMAQSSATSPPNQGAGSPMGEGGQQRAQLEAAQRRLSAARTAVRAKFEASDEYIQAQQELNDAQRAFDQAREPVMARLRETDEYKRAQHEAQLASDRVAKEREQEEQTHGSPTTQPAAATQPVPESLLDAVYKQMDERNDVSRMEAQAIAQDPTASKARAELEKASARIGAIRAKYNAALLNDPDFVAAQKAVDDARVNGAGSGGAVGGSRGGTSGV